MPFIGKTPETGAFRLIDSITTSATDTYALTVQGDHYFPESARNLIVSLNGVTQAPETAYTVSGSHIVFASALTSSDVIDYILVIGDAVDIGTPSDGTVGNAQLKASLDLSGKTLTFSADQVSGDAIDGGTISNVAISGTTASFSGDLTVDTNTLYVDSTNNRVGIGTANPAGQLSLYAETNAGLKNYSANRQAILETYQDSSAGFLRVFDIASNGDAATGAGSTIRFSTESISGTTTEERMRIDASGNLLVGTTNPNPTSAGVNDAGVELSNTGGVRSTVASNPAATFNRKTDDGHIALFRKDGTTLGVIGNHTNKLEITGNGSNTVTFGHAQSTSSGAGIYSWHTNNALVPYNSAAHDIPDGVQSLGHGSYRWKDLYLSGGAYLGGTGSANHLDDYEEGTWTPALTQGSATFLDFKYIKVGNFVYVTGFVYNFTDRSTASNFKITGLPFTSSLTHRGGQTSLYRFINRGDAGIVQYISSNTSSIAFYGNAKNGDYEPVYHSHMASSATNYYISVSYRVD